MTTYRRDSPDRHPLVKKWKDNSRINPLFNALEEQGPLSRAELAEILQIPSKEVGGMLTWLSKARPGTPKRIYVFGYVHDHPGARRYPRALYAIGTKKNAPKPPALTNTERTAKYYKKATRLTITSVFDLGIKAHDRLKSFSGRGPI